MDDGKVSEEMIAEFDALKTAASKAFSPRTPISTKELFAGRWAQMQTIGDTVAQIGLHAVIFGERGVGKTSLSYVIAPLLRVLDSAAGAGKSNPRIVVRVNAHSTDTFSSLWTKALDEIFWFEDRPTIGIKPIVGQEKKTLREVFGIGNEVSIDEARRTLVHLTGSVFIFDEFDRLQKKHAAAFTDLIKALSDAAIQTTVVLVGVAETVDGLMKDHASIGRSLVQIPMPRMNENELREILKNAEKALSVAFDAEASAQIVRMSQGLPHFTHLIGLNAVRAAADRLDRQIGVQDVKKAFGDAAAQSDQTVASAYSVATHSAQPGAKYTKVLLAAAIAAYTDSDAYGYFQPSSLVGPMTKIMGRQEEIAGFNQHLSQFLEAKRGAVLERDGGPRAYRFRFSQPLLPPYILMRSINDGIVTADAVHEMITSS
jgi:Cdc6-like AAA superfamily ATPase